MKAPSRKRLLLQGATGSIGQSTLDVVRERSESFAIAGLSAYSKAEALLRIAEEFTPESIAIEKDVNGDFAQRVKLLGVRSVYCGDGAIVEQAEALEYDLYVNALVGNAGMRPTLAALGRGINVALANKETLVAAGEIVMKTAKENGAMVIPIDSEHSAILQCLVGENPDRIRKLWLTTSGGPFWGKSQAQLEEVTPAQALRHPRWKMGAKITIDSATLLNKGFEVIEAQRLFGLPVEQIGVVRHAEHIIHSFVEFVDGSFKAQLGTPDMRLPVLYALGYPDRLESHLVNTDPSLFGSLSFDPVDSADYPCLDLAYQALARGKDVPAVLSAADEVAVHAFLENRIMFNDIATILSAVLSSWIDGDVRQLNDVVTADRAARKKTQSIIESMYPTRKLSCC
jgi:1-deoxy-D-xylulose-5-phosphate reductoisomerase